MIVTAVKEFNKELFFTTNQGVFVLEQGVGGERYLKPVPVVWPEYSPNLKEDKTS